MSVERQLRYSYEDYLRVLEDSEVKLEYSAGLIYAMAGGTLAHAQLTANATVTLKRAAGRKCTVFSSDARVRVEASDFAGFPDVSMVCGERLTSRIDAHALTNPTLLVEVTSRSTEITTGATSWRTTSGSRRSRSSCSCRTVSGW